MVYVNCYIKENIEEKHIKVISVCVCVCVCVRALSHVRLFETWTIAH